MRTHGLTILASLLLLAGCPTRPKHDDRPTVTITSPISGTYTNGVIMVSVAVAGEPGVPVTLLVDDDELGTLSPPYSMAWNTGTVEEGVHTLVAQLRYDDEMIPSSPVSVVVDRTPPTVVSTIPAGGAIDVALRAPITIELSEPVLPETFPAGLELANGDDVPGTTVTVASDGRSARIAIDDPTATSQALSFPITFSVPLNTITDRAGNRLSLPAQPWSWTVPAWVKLPTLVGGGRCRLGVGPDHRPVLLSARYVSMGMGGSTDLFVSRYDGQSWIDHGAVPAPRADSDTGLHGFSVDFGPDGAPIVAWTELAELGRAVRVGSRQASGWSLLPPVQYGRAADTVVTDPIVKVDPSGRPVVAWRESIGPNQAGIFVARWNGSQWDVSFPGLGFRSAFSHDLAFKGGEPVVSWQAELGTGLSTWNGIDWVRSPVLTGLVAASLAVSPSGRPSMVGGSATGYLVSELDGTAWQTATGMVTPASTAARNPRLALAPDGAPVVAWEDTTAPTRAGFARWTGSEWYAPAGLFHEMYALDRAPELVVDGHGTIWVAWTEQSGSRAYVWMSSY